MFEFIEAHKREFSIVKMCRVLKVSTSGYYKWLAKQAAPITEKEEYKMKVTQKIKQSFHESYGTYGSPRVHKDLLEWGYPLSQRTVANIMRVLELCATQPRSYVTTTDSSHDALVYPNILKRMFYVEEPDQVWVADITYIRTLEGWVYLASIMDLYSRKIVAWEMADHMKVDLVLIALKKAFFIRRPKKGLIHHSDRGAQYCSTEYIELLKKHGCQISMSKKGDPYDNACIESFHATIKKEMIYRQKFQTKKAAFKAINGYISNFYNERRRHSTLGYRSPNQFERLTLQKHAS